MPSTQQSLAATDASSPEANAINGHEWLTSAVTEGDLQYACVFKLPTPQPDCTTAACDRDPARKNPLCQDDAGKYTDTQYRAKAYPGVRELGVLKEIGDQAIVASVCPAQLDDDRAERGDYGYRAATGAIVDKLKSRLSGECLHRALTPDKNKQVECLIIEARAVPPSEACSCDAPSVQARQDIQSAHAQAKQQVLDDAVAKAAGWNRFCEIKQLSGDEQRACQYDASRFPKTEGGKTADGWCYIDANSNPPAGDAALVGTCPATEQRKLRFVGAGEPLNETTLFITCSGE